MRKFVLKGPLRSSLFPFLPKGPLIPPSPPRCALNHSHFSCPPGGDSVGGARLLLRKSPTTAKDDREKAPQRARLHYEMK